MNIKEIAFQLVTLREGTSPFIMQGVLREQLGFDGYGEALRRGWIFADMETPGMVQITNALGTIGEMRQLAEEYVAERDAECEFCHKKGDECKCTKCPDCKQANCTCESQLDEKVMSWTTFTSGNKKYHYDDAGRYREGEAPRENRDKASPVIAGEDPKKKKRKWWHSESVNEDAHHLVVSHSHRLHEIATFGLGNPEHAHTPTQPSVKPPPPTTTQPPKRETVDVGSDVRVVEAGKSYVGKIAAVKDDGKFEISFAGADKPAVERAYDRTEVTPFDEKTGKSL